MHCMREAQCVRARVRVKLSGQIADALASKGAEALGPRSAMKLRRGGIPLRTANNAPEAAWHSNHLGER